MTVEAPEALRIEARTDAGSGLALPLAKGLSHLWLVWEASSREWPLTMEQAAAEVAECVQHLTDINYPHDLLTQGLIGDIATWTASLSAYSRDLNTASARTPDDPFTAEQRAELQDIIRQTWSLISLIDREITGLDHTADPGRRP